MEFQRQQLQMTSRKHIERWLSWFGSDLILLFNYFSWRFDIIQTRTSTTQKPQINSRKLTERIPFCQMWPNETFMTITVHWDCMWLNNLEKKMSTHILCWHQDGARRSASFVVWLPVVTFAVAAAASVSISAVEN